MLLARCYLMLLGYHEKPLHPIEQILNPQKQKKKHAIRDNPFPHPKVQGEILSFWRILGHLETCPHLKKATPGGSNSKLQFSSTFISEKKKTTLPKHLAAKKRLKKNRPQNGPQKTKDWNFQLPTINPSGAKMLLVRGSIPFCGWWFECRGLTSSGVRIIPQIASKHTPNKKTTPRDPLFFLGSW